MTVCHDKRPCFARTSKKNCTLLNQSYDRSRKPCPFCKAHMDDITPTKELFPKKPKKMVIEHKLQL